MIRLIAFAGASVGLVSTGLCSFSDRDRQFANYRCSGRYESVGSGIFGLPVDGGHRFEYGKMRDLISHVQFTSLSSGDKWRYDTHGDRALSYAGGDSEYPLITKDSVTFMPADRDPMNRNVANIVGLHPYLGLGFGNLTGVTRKAVGSRIHWSGKDAGDNIQIWTDKKQPHLPVRIAIARGFGYQEIFLDDYRVFDGLQVPTKIRSVLALQKGKMGPHDNVHRIQLFVTDLERNPSWPPPPNWLVPGKRITDERLGNPVHYTYSELKALAGPAGMTPAQLLAVTRKRLGM